MRRIVIRRGSRSSLSGVEWCERHRVQVSSVSINKMFASTLNQVLPTAAKTLYPVDLGRNAILGHPENAKRHESNGKLV